MYENHGNKGCARRMGDARPYSVLSNLSISEHGYLHAQKIQRIGNSLYRCIGYTGITACSLPAVVAYDSDQSNGNFDHASLKPLNPFYDIDT